MKFLLCFFLLFLINSCGGTSTDAGETEILYIDRLDDASIFEEGESGRPDSNRKKTGFYRHNNHQWGFEYGTDSDKRSPAHISLPLDGEGYTEWYIQWSKTENISEEVYYICNANNEDISNFNKNLIPIGIDECTINSDEIDKLHKSCGTINIRDYKDYEQIGICKKFQDNPASLEAILFIHPYNKVNFELYSIHYGGTKSSSFSNSLNRVFNQGVASITLNDKDEQQIWARHISISSRAVTKRVGSGQIAFALQNDTYAMLHEVGHLLNLSDIELEGTLMNYSFSSNIGQNLRYSEVMARENDLSPFDKPEHQWDCLHDVSRCAYPF